MNEMVLIIKRGKQKKGRLGFGEMVNFVAFNLFVAIREVRN